MNKINRIEKLRKKFDLSQSQLGKKVGVSQNTISAWETELYMPPTPKLIILSTIFGVTIEEILGLTPDSTIIA